MSSISIIFAASLSLLSTNDYMFAVPTEPSFIRSVGMGHPADYTVMRMEDVIFLGEAIRERKATLHANEAEVYEMETNATLPQVTYVPKLVPTEHDVNDLIDEMSRLVNTKLDRGGRYSTSNFLTENIVGSLDGFFRLTGHWSKDNIYDYISTMAGTNYLEGAFFQPAKTNWTSLLGAVTIPCAANVSDFLYGNLKRGKYVASLMFLKSTNDVVRSYDESEYVYLNGAYVTNRTYTYDRIYKPDELLNVESLFYEALSSVEMKRNSLGDLETSHLISGSTAPTREGWELIAAIPLFKGQEAELKKLYVTGVIEYLIRTITQEEEHGFSVSHTTNIVSSTFMMPIHEYTKIEGESGRYVFKLSPVDIEESALLNTGFSPVRQDPQRPYDFIKVPQNKNTTCLASASVQINSLRVLGIYRMTWNARTLDI